MYFSHQVDKSMMRITGKVLVSPTMMVNINYNNSTIIVIIIIIIIERTIHVIVINSYVLLFLSLTFRSV